jgi:hypothetical protein
MQAAVHILFIHLNKRSCKETFRSRSLFGAAFVIQRQPIPISKIVNAAKIFSLSIIPYKEMQ